MSRPNLYEMIGVAPTASRGEIEGAIRRQLALTSDESSRDEIVHAASTLLDTASRASYNRLLGLDASLSGDGRGEWLQGEMEHIAARERRRNEAGLRAELFMTLYMSAAALLLALWLLVMIRFLPTFTPQIEQLLQFYGWTEQATAVAAVLLTIPFGGAAWFLMHLFESEMEVVGRFLITCGLLVATIVMAMQMVRSDSIVAPVGMALVAIPLLFLCIPLVRRMGMNDLMAATGPRTGKARRKP